MLGLALAIVGFGLFYEDKVSHLLVDLKSYNAGILWILFGGLTWALYAVFHKIACKKHETQQINLVIYGLSSLLYLPFISFSGLQSLDSVNWILLISTGFNTILAYGAVAEALKHAPASKVSLIICLNPILTMILSSLAFSFDVKWMEGEILKSLAWAGAGLVIVGAALVVSGRKAKDQKLEA